MTNQVVTSRHILEEIVLHKRQEVAQMQQELPLASLQQQLIT
jgi:indole-3-glycerol phosphate synthase